MASEEIRPTDEASAPAASTLPSEVLPPEIRRMAFDLGIDLSDPKAASVFLRIVTFRSSPYPDTNVAREWEQIYPGAAKVFIDMPSNQAQHRQSMERFQSYIDAAVRLLGTIFAGSIALSSVYGAISLAPKAKDGFDYMIILILLIVGVGGTNIIPRLIERLPRFKITREDSNS